MLYSKSTEGDIIQIRGSLAQKRVFVVVLSLSPALQSLAVLVETLSLHLKTPARLALSWTTGPLPCATYSIWTKPWCLTRILLLVRKHFVFGHVTAQSHSRICKLVQLVRTQSLYEKTSTEASHPSDRTILCPAADLLRKTVTTVLRR